MAVVGEPHARQFLPKAKQSTLPPPHPPLPLKKQQTMAFFVHFVGLRNNFWNYGKTAQHEVRRTRLRCQKKQGRPLLYPHTINFS